MGQIFLKLQLLKINIGEYIFGNRRKRNLYVIDSFEIKGNNTEFKYRIYGSNILKPGTTKKCF